MDKSFCCFFQKEALASCLSAETAKQRDTAAPWESP
jgi:hypothetical protein